MLVLAKLPARHGTGDLRPRGASVGEERVGLERLIARLIVHVLAASRQHHCSEQRRGQ
jgi:hypothetical protein